MVSGVNCDKCKYGYLLPITPLDYNSVWSCSNCDHLLTNDDVAARVNDFEEKLETMEKNKVKYCNF